MRLYTFLTENKNNSIGIFTGRFQPFHIGHASIVSAMSKENSIGYVWVVSGDKSHTDKKRNPIPQQDIVNLIKSVCESNIKVLAAKSAYIPDLVKNLNLDTSKKLVIYAGNDRTESYTRFIKILKEMGYDVEINTKDFNRQGISGTKVRELMVTNSKDAQKLLPYPVSKIEKWFN